MRRTKGTLVYSDKGFNEAELAERELLGQPWTRRFIASNTQGCGHKYGLTFYLRHREPETGLVQDLGWYEVGLVEQGEKTTVLWYPTFQHWVTEFAVRWREGCVVWQTPMYKASAGGFFRNLGIWFAHGDYMPILDEIPIHLSEQIGSAA